MNEKLFQSLMGALAVTFDRELTEPLLSAYWIALSDMDGKAFDVAVTKAIRTLDHMPKPAELRRLGGEMVASDRAMVAWAAVERAIPLGPYKHIDFTDPCINAAIRTQCGGWPNVIERMGDTESQVWMRLNFLKAYEAMERTGVDGDVCKPLAGLSEKTVVNGEICDPVPVRIECQTDRLRIETTQRQLQRIEP